MSEALNYHVENIKTEIDGFDNDMLHLSGLDSSAAPSKN
jgi:hypothetical protein